MKHIRPVILFSSLFLLAGALEGTARAQVRPGSKSVGVLSNGVMANAMIGPRWSAGVQAQRQSGVWVTGLRQRRFFNPDAPRTNFFWAFEENLVTFDVDNIRGRGWTLGTALGLAHFITPRLALEVDAGPAYLDLSDSSGEGTNQGLEFVANVGMSWHWGGR